jgi:hypothetical protein
MGFEIPTAVRKKITIFWDFITWRLVEFLRRYGK